MNLFAEVVMKYELPLKTFLLRRGILPFHPSGQGTRRAQQIVDSCRRLCVPARSPDLAGISIQSGRGARLALK